MRRKFIMLGFFVILASCESLLTENENKGIGQILEFFGGQCEYSVGVSTSTAAETQKYFELKLSKSNALTKYKNNKEIVTSKLAYLFFENLNEEEKANYTHIRGTLLYENEEEFSKDYSVKELETVRNKLSIADEVILLIKNKNFMQLKEILNDQGAFRYDKSELIENVEKLEPEFGNIAEYRFFGFNFSNAGNQLILKLYGVVLRDRNNHELSIYVDPNSKKREVLKLDYTL
jgi:hypothetical protein